MCICKVHINKIATNVITSKKKKGQSEKSTVDRLCYRYTSTAHIHSTPSQVMDGRDTRSSCGFLCANEVVFFRDFVKLQVCKIHCVAMEHEHMNVCST